MSLYLQLRSLLYFFLMGVGYSFVLAYILCVIQVLKYGWIKNMIEFITHLSFTIILYFGLISINQGIIHLYFIVSLTFGFFFGYVVYQPIVLPFAMRLKHQIQHVCQKYKVYQAKRKAKKLAKQKQDTL